MKRTNKYLRAGSFYLVGNFFNKGIAFLTVPIFTRILTTYDYGVINTYVAWAGILAMILGMAFHMGIRAAFNDYEDQINDFMSSITFFSIISAFSITVLIVILIKFLKVNINLTLVIMCLVQGFSVAIIENYSMYLMMKVKYKVRTLMLVLPNLVINVLAIITIIFIVNKDIYMGKIVPSFFVNGVFALIILFIIFKKSRVLVNKNYWKYALNISLPIILHGLSLNILSQSDRIMITSLIGASETGVYSLIYNFSMIASVVIVSLEGVWVPWFTKKLNEENFNKINENAKIYIGIVTYVIVSIIFVSPEILKLMAPKEYWYGKIIIPPIVLSNFIVFIYTLYVNIEHYYKKTKRIAMNTMIAAVSNIILNFIFIPMYGIYAAAYTTLTAYLISLSLHYLNSRKIQNKLFPLKVIAMPIIYIIIVVTGFYLAIENTILRWSVWILLTLIIFNKQRSKIVNIIKERK